MGSTKRTRDVTLNWPCQGEGFEAEEKALGPAVGMAGSEDKLAGGLDGSRPENFKSKKSFNTPAGLWKRGKKEWRKKVRSPKGRELGGHIFLLTGS